MPWDVLVFYLIAAISVLSAVGLVVSNNPIHAGAFLILCFINIAAVFVMLGAEFLAAVQVIVYAGAILVLVLFVLMLVDPDDLPEFHTARPVQRIVGLLLGLILLLEVGAAILNRTVVGQQGNATPINVAAVGGNTQGGRERALHAVSAAVHHYFDGLDGRCHRRDRAGAARAAGRAVPAAGHDLARSPAGNRSGAGGGAAG